MMELIFVIVIMGIMAKFGVELFKQIYENYSRSLIVNKLMSESSTVMQQISNRLRHRIRDSELASGVPLSSSVGGETRLEWIGVDNDGWRTGNWSGIIDLNHAATNTGNFVSPRTTSVPANSAIRFIGANVNVMSGLWYASAGRRGLHPVTYGATSLVPTTPFAIGDDIYEFYQVSDSAYAIDLVGDELRLYSNYQPWNGDIYTKNSFSLLADHVSTFTFQKIGENIVIELCLNSANMLGEDYSICKEQIVF